MRALQRFYNIKDDGCAGPVTWSKLRGSVMPRCSPGYVCQTASHYANLGFTTQYFNYRSNCEWASYTNNNPVGGPVKTFSYYALDGLLHGPNCRA